MQRSGNSFGNIRNVETNIAMGCKEAKLRLRNRILDGVNRVLLHTSALLQRPSD